jgi:phenylalanyl-tRNA synthetase alpha chain
VAQLPPEERGAVGRAANEARKALEAAIEARQSQLASSELEAKLARTRSTSRFPAAPPGPSGAST